MKMEEVLIGEPQVEETIPPYRGAKTESGVPFTEKHSVTPVEERLNIDTKELSKDLVGAAFDIAHLVNKKIRVATEEEKVNIGEPLAKIIDKYDLTKYAKYFSYVDEFRFLYSTVQAVTIRMKEVKETPKTPDAPPMDES